MRGRAGAREAGVGARAPRRRSRALAAEAAGPSADPPAAAVRTPGLARQAPSTGEASLRAGGNLGRGADGRGDAVPSSTDDTA